MTSNTSILFTLTLSLIIIFTLYMIDMIPSPNDICSGMSSSSLPPAFPLVQQTSEKKKTYDINRDVYPVLFEKRKSLVQRFKEKGFEEIEQWNKYLDQRPDDIVGLSKRTHHDLPFLWFIYKPVWICHDMERIGEVFDGGKWICGLRRLGRDTPCVVYSFGSDNKVEFEITINYVAGCEIHIFDPTLKTTPTNLPSGVNFHPTGLSNYTGVAQGIGDVSTLSEIMKSLGHTRLDVLKVDIDTMEYDVFRQVNNTGFPPIDQVLIELHWAGSKTSLEFFDIMENNGYEIFMNEVNLFYRDLPAAGIEYSFIKTSSLHATR